MLGQGEPASIRRKRINSTQLNSTQGKASKGQEVVGGYSGGAVKQMQATCLCMCRGEGSGAYVVSAPVRSKV